MTVLPIWDPWTFTILWKERKEKVGRSMCLPSHCCLVAVILGFWGCVNTVEGTWVLTEVYWLNLHLWLAGSLTTGALTHPQSISPSCIDILTSIHKAFILQRRTQKTDVGASNTQRMFVSASQSAFFLWHGMGFSVAVILGKQEGYP